MRELSRYFKPDATEILLKDIAFILNMSSNEINDCIIDAGSHRGELLIVYDQERCVFLSLETSSPGTNAEKSMRG